MKTYAVIIAGGVGSRMGASIPKQFINIKDKPVIIYTLEAFEKNPMVDEIEVVCIEGWEEMLKAYAKQFGIKKLKHITKGGNTGQESIRNGVFNLKGKAKKGDIIIIHDGVRPIVDQEVLSDVIVCAKENGNACSSMPYNEQIFRVTSPEDTTTTEYIPRETLRRVVTPQAYEFNDLYSAYIDDIVTVKIISNDNAKYGKVVKIENNQIYIVKED